MADTQTNAEAKKVRKSIGNLWQAVMGRLANELKGYADAKKRVPESFCKKLKIASDQLRLDYRLDPAAEAADSEPRQSTEPADPLSDLRIVG